MKFRILDLFCGAGGFSYGLESVDYFETLIGVDNDDKVLETFSKNFKKASFILGDISDINIKKKIITESLKKNINMIIGGPPCQGFSLKGKNAGIEDPRNFLFLEFLEIVKHLLPEVFIIENVKNLVFANNGFFINQIIEKFSKLGYIVNFGILNAKNFGIPQNRERAIIIGSKTKSVELPVGNENIVTAKEAISDLAFLESGEGKFCINYPTSALSKYQEEMRKESRFVYNHIATRHSEIALKKLKMIPPEGDKSSLPLDMLGKQKFSTTWSRLIWDKPSPTIDTRFDTPSNGRNSHPYLNRAITPREAARLQSFSDVFIFYGKKCSICKQIGNAVPPKLASFIGKSIIKAYKEEEITTGKFELHLKNSSYFVKVLQKKRIMVDAIITDPPYNISKKNNFNTLNFPRKGTDFGQWDKNFDVCSWIGDHARVLKPNGCFIIFCSYIYISFIIQELKKFDIDVKDIIIWKKTNPMPRNTKRRYVQDMEFAIWAVKKGSKWTFNKPEEVPYLRSTFESGLVSGKEKTDHPTQKSLKVMNDIIKIHTKKGDLILDPFMGSGTTGISALLNERKFIGIEINPDYFKICLDRFKKNKFI